MDTKIHGVTFQTALNLIFTAVTYSHLVSLTMLYHCGFIFQRINQKKLFWDLDEMWTKIVLIETPCIHNPITSEQPIFKEFKIQLFKSYFKNINSIKIIMSRDRETILARFIWHNPASDAYSALTTYCVNITPKARNMKMRKACSPTWPDNGHLELEQNKDLGAKTSIISEGVGV
jgi:hypothetical protein